MKSSLWKKETSEVRSKYTFISYSSSQKQEVREVVEYLEARGLSCWFDKGIREASEWLDTIQEKLSHADGFLLLITKESLASKWVRREIQFALRLQVSRGMPLFLFRLDGTRFPSNLGFLEGIQEINPHTSEWHRDLDKLAEVIAEHLDAPLAQAPRPPLGERVKEVLGGAARKTWHFGLRLGLRSVLPLLVAALLTGGLAWWKWDAIADRLAPAPVAPPPSTPKSVTPPQAPIYTHAVVHIGRRGVRACAVRVNLVGKKAVVAPDPPILPLPGPEVGKEIPAELVYDPTTKAFAADSVQRVIEAVRTLRRSLEQRQPGTLADVRVALGYDVRLASGTEELVPRADLQKLQEQFAKILACEVHAADLGEQGECLFETDLLKPEEKNAGEAVLLDIGFDGVRACVRVPQLANSEETLAPLDTLLVGPRPIARLLADGDVTTVAGRTQWAADARNRIASRIDGPLSTLTKIHPLYEKTPKVVLVGDAPRALGRHLAPGKVEIELAPEDLSQFKEHLIRDGVPSGLGNPVDAEETRLQLATAVWLETAASRLVLFPSNAPKRHVTLRAARGGDWLVEYLRRSVEKKGRLGPAASYRPLRPGPEDRPPTAIHVWLAPSLASQPEPRESHRRASHHPVPLEEVRLCAF